MRLNVKLHISLLIILTLLVQLKGRITAALKILKELLNSITLYQMTQRMVSTTIYQSQCQWWQSTTEGLGLAWDNWSLLYIPTVMVFLLDKNKLANLLSIFGITSLEHRLSWLPTSIKHASTDARYNHVTHSSDSEWHACLISAATAVTKL